MRTLTLVFLVGAILCAEAPAQDSGSSDQRAVRRRGPVYSPEIGEDRKVTFRLRAPKAEEVAVYGEWGGQPVAMTKGEDEVWSATVGPLEPELYGYGFVVDGVRLADPGNPKLKPMRSPATSILDIPGEPPLIHDFQKVPQGAVSSHHYFSEELDGWRRVHVYSPPGYENGTEKYPVLYLLHGAGDNDATWSVLGRANAILDNLIARKKAQPMIIVMTDGHPIGNRITGGVGPEMIRNNVKAFEKDLLEEVIPLVEEKYRVKANRENRAIAGLSMGGGQSLNAGLNHPEQFGYVAGFSSYVVDPEKAEFTVYEQEKPRPLLIWTACGKDDFLIENARQFSKKLEARGVKHEFLETEGNHSWPVWRKYLAQFAPLLFRQ